MTHHWDEFSKSLAEKSVPRRDTLRLFGAALAGALLGPLGARNAWAAGDPCRNFCKCRNKKQQNACLAACRACSGDTSRLCGSCGSGYVCTDLADDFDNCGACGAACAYPGPYEDGACVDGQCFYSCVEGATDCGGRCTDLGTDPNNCGECGNVCPASAPVCVAGACIPSTCTPSCPEGWCGGDGCGGECACPSGMYCEYDGWCYSGCVFPYILCGGVCVDPLSDSSNCGACGNVCSGDYYVCISGGCWDPICQFVEC